MIFKNKFLMSLFFTSLLLTSIKVHAEIPSTHVYTKYSENIKIFTKKQVIEDIDYIMDKIKNIHVSCVNEIPKEVLDQKDFEIQNLSESTSVIEEWRIISRILAKFHDAHTRVLSPRFLSNTRLPFDVEYVNNKFLCKSTDLIGAEIIEINGMKILNFIFRMKLKNGLM